MSKASDDIQERELHQLQLMQENAKESCMTSFRLLHSLLQVLSYVESKSRRVSERAFMTFFGQDNETFTNTGIKVTQFRETLLQHMGNVKKSIAERARHQRQYERRDSPEFCEFFEINELKAHIQAKNSTINNLKKQIKHVHVKSNKAKVKHNIGVLETINIKLESIVAKLLTENEKLNKENKHLKRTYKELFDLRIHTKDHNDSLIAQVNSKTVENADLKAQIQEKVFANATLKNEFRKLKGTCVDTKFAKPSILGKPVLQPHKNQSVVRQPSAFKFERCKFSKLRFASQVDVINDLSKPVTPHYMPKVRESVFVKPHHVIASGSSRNSSNESYRSNYMAQKYYLEVAKKKTQDKNTSLKTSVRHNTSLQNTTNGSKPNPRSNNQTSRSFPVSKSSCDMSNGVPLVAHSRNSSSYSESKHFICSTCQKYVFNANHDDCITKFLKKVNSRAKSFAVREKLNTPRSCLRWIPTGRIFKTDGLRWIPTGNMFTDSTTKVDSEPPNGSNKDITNPYECKQSLDSFAVREKLNTPRSCLRWIPTGRIFKTDGLRWIPTGNMFTDSTTKVDSEPPNGSNEDITNPYECKQSLDVSACTLNLSAVQASDLNVNKMTSDDNTSGPAPQRKERFSTAIAAPRVVDPGGSPSLTTIDQDVPSAITSPTAQEIQSQVTHQGAEEQIHGHQNAQFDNAPLLHNLSSDPSSKETTLQWFIPSNLHHLNQ
nr:hypothetical protein [Tanacetum cinerariifolium]